MIKKLNLGQRTHSDRMQEILSDAVRKNFGRLLIGCQRVIVHHYTDTPNGIQIEYEILSDRTDQTGLKYVYFGRILLE